MKATIADMAADTADLTKVDSAVGGLSSSPTEKKMGHRRTSSSVSGVFNINDLGRSPLISLPCFKSFLAPCVSCSFELTDSVIEKEQTELHIAPETQKLNWCGLPQATSSTCQHNAYLLIAQEVKHVSSVTG